MARSVPSRAGARRPAPGKKRSASPRTPARRGRSAAARRRRAAVRARRLRTALIAGLVTVAVVTPVGVVGVVALAAGAFRGFADCPVALGPAAVEVWDAEQLGNAATIMRAGSDLGLPLRDQAIGVMTAMGESSLRNLDHGDWETSGVTNPDGSRTTSIGLFQQQDEWGSRDERRDPYTAAGLFYRAMTEAVPAEQRQALEPTEVAHRTQINSDPQHYARYWEAALSVVERLSGESAGAAAAAVPEPEPGC